MMKLKAIFLCSLLATNLPMATAGESNSTAPTTSPSAAPEQFGIVMRLSKELFEDLTRDVVEMTIPIEHSADGNRLTGQATGKGFTDIQMTTSDEHAEFVISLKGDAVGTLRSDVGPAIVRLTSRAQFRTEQRLKFDGHSFRADSATAGSCNCTTIDRVCAKRRGPVGRLVEGIGGRIARKSIPEINSMAEKATRDLLVETFNESTVQLVDELNQTSQFDELVEKYFPETQSWKYKMATRPKFMAAGLGPASSSFPDFLIDEKTDIDAHMELWLRLSPGQAAMLEMVGELGVTNELMLGLLPGSNSSDMVKDVKLERHGDWSVIKMGKSTPAEN